MDQKKLTKKQEEKRETNKKYYQKYRDRIIEKSRTYVLCPICGKHYRSQVRTLHDRTEYHRIFAKLNDIVTNSSIGNI